VTKTQNKKNEMREKKNFANDQGLPIFFKIPDFVGCPSKKNRQILPKVRQNFFIGEA